MVVPNRFANPHGHETPGNREMREKSQGKPTNIRNVINKRFKNKEVWFGNEQRLKRLLKIINGNWQLLFISEENNEKCLCLTASMDSTIFEVQSTKTLGRRRNASKLVNTAFTTRTASPGSLLVVYD